MTRTFQTVLVAFLALFFPFLAPAQIVQSFCNGPNSLQNQYAEDAWYIAFEHQMKIDSANMVQTVPVPANIKDSVLASLLGIYNANLPARDTVIQMYNIHAFKDIDLKRFEIYLDTAFGWAKKLAAGEIGSTGNFYVDSLSNLYGFSLDFVQYFPEWVVDFDVMVRLKTSQYVNTDFMAEIMLSQDGVRFANAYTFGGDGNRIFYDQKPDFTEIVFRRGWEDCPSGCLFRRDWLFRVYPDCQVEFAQSYGDQITPVFEAGENLADRLKVFPNPSTDRLFFELENFPGGDFLAKLTDASGKTRASRFFKGFPGFLRGDFDVRDLSNGVYFLTLTHENQHFTKRVIVNR